MPSPRIAVVGALLLLCGRGGPAVGEGPQPTADSTPSVAALGVSPGALERFAGAPACPTFSWTSVAGAARYELAVVHVETKVAAQGEAQETESVLARRVPAGATSWSPATDECLAAGGRYAWSIRALDDAGAGAWSEALLFEVATAPGDLAAALEVVKSQLGTDQVGEQHSTRGSAPSPTRSVAAVGAAPLPDVDGDQAGSAGKAGEGGVMTAVLGEVADPAGETYGVTGVSHSPDGAGVRAENSSSLGADLVLGGTVPAALTEAGLTRDSDAAQAFDFGNATGPMTLLVEGIEVVTVATDQDTLGGLSCAEGDVAKFLSGVWSCDGGGGRGNADTLDGLDSTQFLRSDVADTMTGLLTLDPAAGLARRPSFQRRALHTRARAWVAVARGPSARTYGPGATFR